MSRRGIGTFDCLLPAGERTLCSRRAFERGLD
jgi:hypothetical protein